MLLFINASNFTLPAVLRHNTRKGNLHRGMVIPHMVNVTVSKIHAEIFKTLIDVILNVLLPSDTGINLILRVRGKFSGNHIFITLCKIPYSPYRCGILSNLIFPTLHILFYDYSLQDCLNPFQ